MDARAEDFTWGALHFYLESTPAIKRLYGDFSSQEGTGELARLDNICEKQAEKAHFQPILSTNGILVDCVAAEAVGCELLSGGVSKIPC